jgi:hypothetical protein
MCTAPHDLITVLVTSASLMPAYQPSNMCVRCLTAFQLAAAVGGDSTWLMTYAVPWQDVSAGPMLYAVELPLVTWTHRPNLNFACDKSAQVARRACCDDVGVDYADAAPNV